MHTVIISNFFRVKRQCPLKGEKLKKKCIEVGEDDRVGRKKKRWRDGKRGIKCKEDGKALFIALGD